MEMPEIFDRLSTLQDVLGQKYRLEREIETLPKQLDSQDELLVRLRKEYIEKNKSYEELRAEVGRHKEELAAAESARESGEKNMDNISSHREYEALDKQISEARDREAAIRKSLLSEEKRLSELNESLKADESMISAQESDLGAARDALNEKINGFRDEVSRLGARESEITDGLNQELVYKFQRIIQRNAEGIVAVRNGVCTGCQMILPGQFANEVRDGEKILFCPYCSRILFYQEVNEDEAEDYSSLEETGSLADFEDEFADERDEDEIEESEADSELGEEASVTFGDD